MRAAVLALALVALPALAQNGPPTVVGEIVKLRQSVGELRGQVADLTTRLAAAEAQVAKNRQDVQNLIVSHNVNVYYFLVRACDFNRRVSGWAGVLTGLQPIPLNGLTCPPEGTRFYVPYFHPDVSAVPIPPAQ